MATFEARIIDLAGDIPATADGGQFCDDAVHDIVGRMVNTMPWLMPKLVDKITVAISTLDDTGLPVLAAQVKYAGDYIDAIEIPVSLALKAADPGSIHYATALAPNYYRSDEKWSVLPTATLASVIFYQVCDGKVSNWDTGTSTIENFPDDWYEAVVLFAATQVLHHKLVVKAMPSDPVLPVIPSEVSLSTTSESLPTFTSPVSVVLPDTPADADVDFSSVPSAPVYAPQSLTLSISEPDALTWTMPATPVAPALSDTTVDTTNLSVPTFVPPSIDIDYTQLTTYIETDEDTELAAVELQKLTTELAEDQVNLQNAINSFNMSNTEYQAQVQIALQNAQLSNSDDALTLQRYNNDVQSYVAQVNNVIQKNQAIMSTWGAEWNVKSQAALGEYSADIQNESARVQMELSIYQQAINKALGKFQSETGYDISKYGATVQAEVQKVGHELNKANADFQSDMAKYTNEVQQVASANQSTLVEYQSRSAVYNSQLSGVLQEFGAKLQKVSVEYGWMQEQYVRLKQQYESLFPTKGVTNG